MDYTPEGFWEIKAFTNGYQIVVLGSPPDAEDLDIPEDDSRNHSCDQVGCGSVGDHVLCRIPIMYPTPELRWAADNFKPEDVFDDDVLVTRTKNTKILED